MLDAFLKTSPKYVGIATGLLASPVGLTAATATIIGGIIAQQLIKNDEIKKCSCLIILVIIVHIGNSE